VNLVVTKHSALRYHERVKPALPYYRAKLELEVLLQQAPELSAVPDWHYTPEPGLRYFLIADGICALAKGNDVVTVLVRGCHADPIREARRAYKAGQRKKRRFASKRIDRLPNKKREAA
jgi:hypothetical protein